jgi:thiamine pyrophosphokinase
VVFVNGVVRDYDGLRRWLQPGDYLVAADGGGAHADALGVRPHIIVGDLDSLAPERVAALEAAGVGVERYPTGKDATDLELAMHHAVAAGAREIVLLGALGGRLDQALANVLILAQRNWPAEVKLVEDDMVAMVLHGGESLALSATLGTTVSLLPLSAQVTGITYQGLLYPLSDATLTLGSTRGISNVVVAQPATIRIDEGIALVVQTVPASAFRPPGVDPAQ